MALILGPLVQFLGVQDQRWCVSVLVVTDTPDAPTLQSAALADDFMPLCSLQNGAQVWRGALAIQLQTSAQRVTYRVGGETTALHVPAEGESPRTVYGSCNGFSSPSLMKGVADKNALWTRLMNLHTGRERVNARSFGPYHVLLMGGDQVYSDTLWQDPTCPDMVVWSGLPRDQRRKAPWTPAMQQQVTAFFENLYLRQWSQPEVAAALASLPSVMMWDDHDIFDGWGSYPALDHDCPIYQGVFRVARRVFALFQRHSLESAPPPCTLPDQGTFTSAYRVGGMGLLVLDMRSERTPERQSGGNLQCAQVLSEATWQAAYQWLDAQEGLTHLLLMSSIPVVHPSFELLEKLLGVLPGQQELEDDLRDHWTSLPLRSERLRLIHRLFQFSQDKGCRVTVLSGDVHVAALGVLESRRNATDANAQVMTQLTSSGVVHPPPAAMVRYFLENACTRVESVDRGITAAMFEFPASSRRLIGARNFMTLEYDEATPLPRLWANWWVENEAQPTTKVIHPVG